MNAAVDAATRVFDLRAVPLREVNRFLHSDLRGVREVRMRSCAQYLRAIGDAFLESTPGTTPTGLGRPGSHHAVVGEVFHGVLDRALLER